MHHSFKMSYLEPILVHPVRRQNFGDAVAQTCNPHLIPCHIQFIYKTYKKTDVFIQEDVPNIYPLQI